MRLAIALVFFWSTFSYAQQTTHLETEVFCQPVLISGEAGTSSGTGFFVMDSSKWYLVTAKHIVLDPKSNKLLSEKLSLTVYSQNLLKEDKNVISIDMKSAFEGKNIFFNVKDDAVAIEIGKIKGKEFAFNTYATITSKSKTDIIKPLSLRAAELFDNIHLGDEIYIFGYPTSFGLKPMPQFDYEKPLLRRGTVAGKYEERHSFVIDCTMFPGNSGGPVIKKITGKTGYSLVGLITGFIPYFDQSIDSKEGKKSEESIYQLNSGYGVMIPLDVINDLLRKKG